MNSLDLFISIAGATPLYCFQLKFSFFVNSHNLFLIFHILIRQRVRGQFWPIRKAKFWFPHFKMKLKRMLEKVCVSDYCLPIWWSFFQFLTMLLVEELVFLFVDEFLPKYAGYRANCLVKLNESFTSSSLLEIEPGEKKISTSCRRVNQGLWQPVKSTESETVFTHDSESQIQMNWQIDTFRCACNLFMILKICFCLLPIAFEIFIGSMMGFTRFMLPFEWR